MADNVPLTIQCTSSGNMNSMIVFGANKLSQAYTQNNLYWIVVVDRISLAVVQNFTFTNNAEVPAQLKPYINNTQYMMMLTTLHLRTANLPTGEFYNFLMSIGAGVELKKLEQLYAALNCGNWGNLAYTLVTILDTTAGLEFSDYQSYGMVNAMTLTPLKIGDKVLYTPISLR